MNKFMSVITVCSILVMSSCGSGNKEEKTLENSGNLLMVTSEVVGGDTLYGVRTIFDTIQVVPMAKWDSIRALSPSVVRAYFKGNQYAYTAKGKQMGKSALKELITVDSSCGVFYRGTSVDGLHCFYFSNSDELIDGVTAMYIGTTVMLLETDGRWETRSYDGKLLWQVPSGEDCFIVRRIYSERETIQVAQHTSEGTMSLFEVDGHLVKEVSAKDWAAAQKNFRRSTAIGSATYGELDIAYTL